jgi:FAD:protein FMN transferase
MDPVAHDARAAQGHANRAAQPHARPAGASWRALGTTATLRVADLRGLGAARAAVERELDQIDRACSRFRADSELSRVNARAGRHASAGALLIEAVALALRAAELTGGDVDPTVGRALELAGYDRDYELLDRACDCAPLDSAYELSARVVCDWRAVRVNRARGTIRVPRGMKLDLGATAKAWAADRAARAAAQAAGCGVLVSLGGDLATAGAGPPGGWPVHVTDDHRSDPSAAGQRIAVSTGGLATSSTVTRRWRHGGRTMHHVIDPARGRPAVSCWRTVSVAAADCADANIAATAALVRSERAPAWLGELGLPARLVAWDGAVTLTGAWPRPASPARAGDARTAQAAGASAGPHRAAEARAA